MSSFRILSPYIYLLLVSFSFCYDFDLEGGVRCQMGRIMVVVMMVVVVVVDAIIRQSSSIIGLLAISRIIL